MLGLYAALALRSLLVDPKPILWGLLWDHETSWLAVPDPAAGARLLARRALRAARAARGRRPGRAERLSRRGARRSPSRSAPASTSRPSACTSSARVLVAVADRHVPGELRVAHRDPAACVRRAPEGGARRRADAARASARDARREPRRHRLRVRRRGRARARRRGSPRRASRSTSCSSPMRDLDERDCSRSSRPRIVAASRCASHRARPSCWSSAASTCRVRACRCSSCGRRSSPAPSGRRSATFDCRRRRADRHRRPAALAAASRSLIKLTSRGPVFYARSAHRARRAASSGCSSSARWSRAPTGSRRRSSSANEAAGRCSRSATIRASPRSAACCAGFSIDEIPNVINVLRGEMSLVGPRPLPIRDYERLEPWHRRRYNVLPGMTGLWQVAGRSDLTLRRPRAARLLLPRELVDLARHLDSLQDAVRRASPAAARTSALGRFTAP